MEPGSTELTRLNGSDNVNRLNGEGCAKFQPVSLMPDANQQNALNTNEGGSNIHILPPPQAAPQPHEIPPQTIQARPKGKNRRRSRKKSAVTLTQVYRILVNLRSRIARIENRNGLRKMKRTALSPRQKQIRELREKGLLQKQVAEALGLKPSSVKTAEYRIRAKDRERQRQENALQNSL